MPSAPRPADRRAADIIQSWLDGAAPPDAAAALAGHPDLAGDKAVALDLAFAEFLLREHKGERLDPEAFCARFPDYHASLGRLIAQQSVGDRSPLLDAAAPGNLAERTLNVPIDVVRSPDGPPSGPRRTDGPVASPPGTHAAGSSGTGSSIMKRPGPAAWPEAGGKVGDFNLLRQLGKGAFGRVFLATEETTTRHVVVKVSKQKCDEAKVLGRLGHRNVVAVLSAPHDVTSGLYLVVMPYLGSATLEDLLEVAYPLRKPGATRPKRADVIATAARRNLRPDDPAPNETQPDPFLARAGFVDGIVWLGVRMADALAAVHQCGFVHHDLKPSNVLLGLDGQPRVLDFNLASDVRNAKSRLGGTLPYMPPEHLAAVRHPDAPGQMDARGDVYSLGVILYELLTGAHPFGRFPASRSVKTAADDMLARQKQGVRPIRERCPDVPHRLARLVERCLAFESNDRPQKAADVAAELRRCYSVQKRTLQFLGTRPGRAAVMAASVGLVGSVTWMMSASARPAEIDHRAAGLAAVADGRYAVAVPELLQATQHSPDDAEAWLNLGRARVAQNEWLAARPDLEEAARLRPGHGPTQATLAWCLAKLGEYEQAEAALARAEQAGYAPAALYALRGCCYVQTRQDAKAAAALEQALALDPDNRVALMNRAQLALIQAQAKVTVPPPAAFDDVEHALRAGGPDAYLDLWAARLYAWAAHQPAEANGPWYWDMAGAKARVSALFRQAYEHGAPEGLWNHDSTFGFLLGDLKAISRNWPRPAKEADPSGHWRFGNPLADFGG
jgi:serine/threonine protein kinase/Tfp pilus assembly protein PilF